MRKYTFFRERREIQISSFRERWTKWASWNLPSLRETFTQNRWACTRRCNVAREIRPNRWVCEPGVNSIQCNQHNTTMSQPQMRSERTRGCLAPGGCRKNSWQTLPISYFHPSLYIPHNIQNLWKTTTGSGLWIRLRKCIYLDKRLPSIQNSRKGMLHTVFAFVRRL